MGNRCAHIQAALDWISAHPRITLDAVTPLLETPPWGVINQPPFLNAVSRLFTDLPPNDLLADLKAAEVSLGRDLNATRWGPRVIDLDILIYGELVLDDADLVIPHPRITERDFVIRQLLELEAHLIHPRFKFPLSNYLDPAVAAE